MSPSDYAAPAPAPTVSPTPPAADVSDSSSSSSNDYWSVDNRFLLSCDGPYPLPSTSLLAYDPWSVSLYSSGDNASAIDSSASLADVPFLNPTGTTSSTSSSSSDAAAASAKLPPPTNSMAPWVVGPLTFAGPARVNESTVEALVLALLAADVEAHASPPPLQPLNLTRLSANNNVTAVRDAARRRLNGVTIVLIKSLPVGAASGGAGRRLLAAPAAASVTSAFNVSVQTSSHLTPGNATAVLLSRATNLASLRALLPGLNDVQSLANVSAPSGFTLSADKDGALPFDTFYRGVLPLFGFISDVSVCTSVSLRASQFSPAMMNTYIHPLPNTTNVSSLPVDYDPSAQANIQVVVPTGKEVLVGIYEKSSGLHSLGDFVIYKGARAACSSVDAAPRERVRAQSS